MIEKEFVQQGIAKAKLEEFLEKELRHANYSHMDITKTPTSTHITIYAEKPAIVIGRGGSRIREIIQAFEDDFGIENPQVDAQELEEPDLDAAAVAKNVAGWLEKGGHPKRVGNTYLRRVMDAGAIGVQIEIAGKLSGSRGRSEKFTEGYVKRCGDTAKQYVDYSFEKAVTKPGALGVKVRIMKDMPDYMRRALEEEGPTAEEIIEQAEEDAEDDEAEDADETAETEDEGEEAAAADDVAVADMTVADVKDAVDAGDIDAQAAYDSEQGGKERSTLLEWLERRVGDDAEAEEPMAETDAAAEEDSAAAEDTGTDIDVADMTVADVKDAVEAGDIDAGDAYASEQDGKERKTLLEWLERRVD